MPKPARLTSSHGAMRLREGIVLANHKNRLTELLLRGEGVSAQITKAAGDHDTLYHLLRAVQVGCNAELRRRGRLARRAFERTERKHLRRRLEGLRWL